MRIEIENFKFKTIIGVLDFEREKEQNVIVNLKADYSYQKDNFIDYVEICNTIKNSLKTNKFELLEDALLGIKKELFEKFEINYLELKITKPDILKDCLVSLSNSWSNQ